MYLYLDTNTIHSTPILQPYTFLRKQRYLIEILQKLKKTRIFVMFVGLKGEREVGKTDGKRPNSSDNR